MTTDKPAADVTAPNMTPQAGALYARVDDGAGGAWVGRVVGWLHGTDPGRDPVDVWLPVVAVGDGDPAAVPVPLDTPVTYASTARALDTEPEALPWWVLDLSDLDGYAPWELGVESAKRYTLAAITATVGDDPNGVTRTDLRDMLDELPEDERPTRSEFLGALGALVRDGGLVAVDKSRVALPRAGSARPTVVRTPPPIGVDPLVVLDTFGEYGATRSDVAKYALVGDYQRAGDVLRDLVAAGKVESYVNHQQGRDVTRYRRPATERKP